MFLQDHDDDFGIDVFVLMHDDIAKFRHFLHDFRYLRRDQAGLRQALESIGVTDGHPELPV